MIITNESAKGLPEAEEKSMISRTKRILYRFSSKSSC